MGSIESTDGCVSSLIQQRPARSVAASYKSLSVVIAPRNDDESRRRGNLERTTQPMTYTRDRCFGAVILYIGIERCK